MKLNTAKKLTAGALALSMMFAMAVPMAFATDEKVWTKEDDYKTVDINKVYTAINNDTDNPTANPAETFYLEQVSGAVKSGDAKTAPELIKLTGENETNYVAKVTYAEGEATKSGTSKAFTITLPEYTNVGVYEYMLQEIDGNNAGVSYRKSQLKLVVTVINVDDGTIRVAGVHTESAGDKSDTFGENKYSAGKLDVTKTVTGNQGDKTKEFTFTVKFTKDSAKTFASTVTASVAGAKDETFALNWNDKGEATYEFKLKDGQTATFNNLPYDVKYEVTETNYKAEGYTTTSDGATGSIENATQTAAFVNNKDGDIDTGVILDNAPYILMLAVVAGGAMTLVIKKRREEE